MMTKWEKSSLIIVAGGVTAIACTFLLTDCGGPQAKWGGKDAPGIAQPTNSGADDPADPGDKGDSSTDGPPAPAPPPTHRACNRHGDRVLKNGRHCRCVGEPVNHWECGERAQ